MVAVVHHIMCMCSTLAATVRYCMLSKVKQFLNKHAQVIVSGNIKCLGRFAISQRLFLLTASNGQC